MASEKGQPGGKQSRRVTPPSQTIPHERELIVIARQEANLRATPEALKAAPGFQVEPLANSLASQGLVLEPLFGVSEDRLRMEAASAAPSGEGTPPDLSVYYRLQAPDERLDELAASLRKHPAIAAAYVKPPAELAVMSTTAVAARVFNDMAPLPDEAPPVSPDFSARQIYLNAAPAGIDARYAWTVPGGRGAGVRITDCEWGWRFTHEDLTQNQGGVVVGAAISDDNHGTAVLGEFSGDHNGRGISGICPDAVVTGAAFSLPTASVIRQAANRLGPGDIILLEIHRAGPRATGVGQQGYIAIEWWPDDFDAIRYAVNKGIVVVEAAGNGAQNLDDPVYNTPSAGFPATWRNPFNRANRDSGAVLVGAGAPPPNTHGRDWGPDRSRLDFSNYGSAVDAQGWGREVTSTGYGDLQGGSTRDVWYTDTFSGTSSASPIVVGAIGCVQGALRAAGRIPLSPARARDLLRTTGSLQQDAPGRPATQRIGNRPNLRQLIPTALQTNHFIGVQFTGTVPAGQTRRWFTFNWPAHWHVVWTVVPTSITPGGPQVRWKVQVERASDKYITYWINITNFSSAAANIEARYAVLGW
ncbi:MAG TPA: S8 family peptidase [Terriglobia bacterium]|nr:S8 family peptidase [Terriglobia bacterium]